jgi:hypothetical protein
MYHASHDETDVSRKDKDNQSRNSNLTSPRILQLLEQSSGKRVLKKNGEKQEDGEVEKKGLC